MRPRSLLCEAFIVTPNRKEKMLNITPDTGPFLALLIHAMKARRILEIGTSNGYSTLWLADAAQRVGGRVTRLEVLPDKAEMARRNFARPGLSSWIQLHPGDAVRAFHQTFVLIGVITGGAVLAALRMRPARPA